MTESNSRKKHSARFIEVILNFMDGITKALGKETVTKLDLVFVEEIQNLTIKLAFLGFIRPRRYLKIAPNVDNEGLPAPTSFYGLGTNCKMSTIELPISDFDKFQFVPVPREPHHVVFWNALANLAVVVSGLVIMQKRACFETVNVFTASIHELGNTAAKNGTDEVASFCQHVFGVISSFFYVRRNAVPSPSFCIGSYILEPTLDVIVGDVVVVELVRSVACG